MAGKRGPAKMPTTLRLLTGERRPSEINYDEPIAPDDGLACPEDVTARVREVWDEVVDWLTRMRIAKTPDRYAIRAYCEAVVNHERAAQLSAQSPPVITDREGHIRTNPAWRVERDCSRVLLRWSQEFGLTPSARASITVGAIRDVDASPFAASG